MRCLVIATGLILGLAAPAIGAGPHDGEWTGLMSAEPDSRTRCGFEAIPFRLQVENNRFNGTATDAGGTKRIFEGEISGDGTVDLWGYWGIVGEYTLPMKGTARLTGRFSENRFSGRISAQDNTASFCGTRILLER